MHSFVDQITALLSSSPVNSLKNNGLNGQLPNAELFSSLLSQYAASGEDANLAASGGKFVPLLDYGTSVPIEPASLADDANSRIQERINTSSELPPASFAPETIRDTSEHSNALLEKEILPNNFSQNPVNTTIRDQIIGDKNLLVVPDDNTQSSPQILGYNTAAVDTSGKSNYADRTENSAQPYQQPITPTRYPHDQQQPPSRQAVLQNNGQAVQRTHDSDASEFIRQPLNAEVKARGLYRENITSNTEPAQIVENSRPIKVAAPIASASQNISVPSNVVNSATEAVNILDSRERLPLASVSGVSNVAAEALNTNGKPAVENPINQSNQSGEQTRTQSTQEQFIRNVKTPVLNPDELQSTSLEDAQLVDVRKNSIIASSSVRELGEQFRQIEGRINKNYESDALNRSTSFSERQVFKHDYSPVYQHYTNVESSPTLKFVEINIDQKTPVTVNIGADVSTSLKTLNTESLLSSPREILPSDTVTNSIKPGAIRNGNEIAEQIAWAQRHNAQQVRISIAPEHLGAIDISIDDVADGLNIQFVTQNLQAKEALEQFMPRLKEMLEQSGFNLQNANVSQQGDGKNGFNYSERSVNEFTQEEAENDSQLALNAMENNPAATSSNQLLDAFA